MTQLMKNYDIVLRSHGIYYKLDLKFHVNRTCAIHMKYQSNLFLESNLFNFFSNFSSAENYNCRFRGLYYLPKEVTFAVELPVPRKTLFRQRYPAIRTLYTLYVPSSIQNI